jgi:hypothetical protein
MRKPHFQPPPRAASEIFVAQMFFAAVTAGTVYYTHLQLFAVITTAVLLLSTLKTGWAWHEVSTILAFLLYGALLIADLDVVLKWNKTDVLAKSVGLPNWLWLLATISANFLIMFGSTFLNRERSKSP